MDVSHTGIGATVRCRPAVSLAAVLLLVAPVIHADVVFEINDPATGDPLGDQTVTIVSPDGDLSEQTTGADGIIVLPDAAGSGWTARFIHDGRTYTTAGIADGEADEGGRSRVLIGVLSGLGAVGLAAAAGSDDSARSIEGGGGDIIGADSTCIATVNVNETQIDNPGSITDVPDDGDEADIGVLGNTTLLVNFDLPNLLLTGQLSCGTADANGLDACTGSAVGTFYGDTVTVNFTDSRAETTPMGGIRQIESVTATIDITGGANDYSTRFTATCN